MKKRTYKKIVSLYHEGISSEAAVQMIIGLAETHGEAATLIDKFYQDKVFPKSTIFCEEQE